MKQLAPRYSFAIGVLALLLAGGPWQSSAEPFLTVTCDEPKGPRLQYGPPAEDPSAAPALDRSEDSFTGVRPVFILDSSGPRKMTVVFGSTKHLVPTEAQDAAIIIARPDWIFAVETPSETNIWSYSLSRAGNCLLHQTRDRRLNRLAPHHDLLREV